MVILNADHPDIVDFIIARLRGEEGLGLKKSTPAYRLVHRPAYSSVFFQKLEQQRARLRRVHGAPCSTTHVETHAVRDGSVMDTYKARAI